MSDDRLGDPNRPPYAFGRSVYIKHHTHVNAPADEGGGGGRAHPGGREAGGGLDAPLEGARLLLCVCNATKQQVVLVG